VAPPLLAGAVNETVADVEVTTAGVPIVGALGTVIGVTDDVGELFALVPAEFVAVAVNVYAWPFVNPATETEGPAPDPVIKPGLEVTVYDVTDAPPVSVGVLTGTLTLVVEP